METETWVDRCVHDIGACVGMGAPVQAEIAGIIRKHLPAPAEMTALGPQIVKDSQGFEAGRASRVPSGWVYWPNMAEQPVFIPDPALFVQGHLNAINGAVYQVAAWLERQNMILADLAAAVERLARGPVQDPAGPFPAPDPRPPAHWKSAYCEPCGATYRSEGKMERCPVCARALTQGGL